MTDEKVNYLSLAEAAKLVGAIQEEEDIERVNRQILTVYSKDDKELCWFDFEDVKKEIGNVAAADEKDAVQNYVLHHIPDWALDI